MAVSDVLDNVTGLHEVIANVNTSTDGVFAVMMVISLMLVLYLSFRPQGNLNAMIASSFITSVIAGLAYGAGIVNLTYVFAPLMILVVTVFIKIAKSR